MADLDLGVPPKRHAEASALLLRHGWRRKAVGRPLAVGTGLHAPALVAP